MLKLIQQIVDRIKRAREARQIHKMGLLTWEDVMKELGITEEDLEGWEDVEFEFED